MWECEGVDDGFLEFFNDGVEATNIYNVLVSGAPIEFQIPS